MDLVPVVLPPAHSSVGAHISSLEEYKALYEKSIGPESDAFWLEQLSSLHLFAPPTQVRSGSFERGDIAWFLNAKLNVCFNCVDRHLPRRAQQAALIWEGNDPADSCSITYQQLHDDVCRMANLLKSYGVRRGDAVAIYMPIVPDICVAMLACARIGAVHTVIFAGFSPQAIHDRVVDARASVVITADEGVRGPKRIPLKENVDEAIRDLAFVRNVLVMRRTGGKIHWHAERDHWLHEELARQRPYCPCEWMDAEDPLFFLYTSGSTGKPKGIVHTQAGYLLFTSMSHKLVFDLREGDVYACVADLGWITGHSYILYGPLCNGATSLLFEPTPLHPDAGRYWATIEKHRVTQFYTSPTAIRALMKFGLEFVTK
jgi:acetyl-CoA synthetase